MRFKLLFLGLLCLFTIQVSAQLSTVITSKDNEVLKKFNSFVVVDQATGYAMAKTPVKYSAGKNAPKVYFTKAPTELINIDALVVSINDATNTEEGFWSIYFDASKDITAFCRRRFVADKKRALWTPVIQDNYVIFKAIVSPTYLVIDENGEYGLTHSLSDASKWELIYTK